MTLAAASTHQVFNQTPPLADVNLAALDAPLMGAVRAFGQADDADKLLAHGAAMGTADRLELARLANEYTPKLKPFDPRGERIDFVEFHPAYHELMRASIAAGLSSSTWENGAPSTGKAGRRLTGSGHVTRSAMHYVTAGVEDGHLCPVTMTHAAVAALAAAPEHLAKLLPLICSRSYDPAFRPFWEKSGITLGMGMTEKQGGSDVRANTTRAEPTGACEYEITGHKWFMSAPMCDAFLVLRRPEVD